MESRDVIHDGEDETCANCGDAINCSEWHPVRASNDDGEFRIYAFCSEECLEKWE